MLIRSKQLQDGQVPKTLQHFAPIKVENSNLDSKLEKVMDSVTEGVKKADVNCSKHGKHATPATIVMPDFCSNTLIRSKQLQDGRVPEALQHFASTKADDKKLNSNLDNTLDNDWGPLEAEQCASMSTPTQHQQLQDAATLLSRPPRPPVLPASAEDSVRRHYISPKPQATASSLNANPVINSLRQQSNDVNSESPAQPEHLLVAIPVEEDEARVYAVSHDVSQHEVKKKVQIVRARRYSCRLYFVVFLLVAVAAMIASIVAINKNNNDGQVQETETTMLQNMILHSPQSQLIVSIMGADAVLLNDMSSPYAKALYWLLQSEERNESQLMQDSMVQRFYAASFYFDTTTDVDKWTICNPPNSSSDLNETWGRYENPTIFDEDTGLIGKTWLSDSHECEWYGVVCDSHQQIVGLLLDKMNLVGTVPTSVVKFPFMQVMWVSRTKLEGNISLLSNCHHLVEIDLGTNMFMGNLSSVWQSRKLKWLNAGDNYFTGSLSPQIGNAVDLKSLGLYNNTLTGTIPIEIGLLNSISWFRLTTNTFRGELPQSMQFWTLVVFFHISGNGFAGSFPTFIGQFNETLQQLQMYGNRFTGNLPDELFRLSKLSILDISQNELSGTLDARFAQLNETLSYLDLSSNHFSGTIPTELGLLTNLTKLYLENNQFTGSVPALLCQNEFIEFFTNCAKNATGQAEIQCDCCTFCCSDETHCLPTGL